MRVLLVAFACCIGYAPFAAAQTNDLSIEVAIDVPKIATVDPDPIKLKIDVGYERRTPDNEKEWYLEERRPSFIGPQTEYLAISAPVWKPSENTEVKAWRISTKARGDPFPYENLRIPDGSPDVLGRVEEKSFYGISFTWRH
ncbi:MAG: hypothetical protein ABA06_03405 [Parcubacteria bacterium C7867-001]|nr:MAG: hypothetical protein ABA06_03405 [Parcubacteria bacterium C7867-001]